MDDVPEFSVIMPTFNRAYCIRCAIDSLLAQTFCDFELIIADDGSSDGTIDILKTVYSKQIQTGQFVLLQLRHSGPGAARNAALARARGKWVTYLDTDNNVSPNFLQTFHDGFATSPESVSFYADLVFHSSGNILSRQFSRAEMMLWNLVDIGVYCHRRSLVDEFGGFDESLPALEDWDLVLRHLTKYTPQHLQNVVLCYHDEKDDFKVSFTTKLSAAYAMVRKKNLVRTAFKDEDLDLIRNSPFFDESWYAATYQKMIGAEDAAVHYLSAGWRLGCNPSPAFDGLSYLRTNADVAKSGMNPLIHYERHGRAEGRTGFVAWLISSFNDPRMAKMITEDNDTKSSLHNANAMKDIQVAALRQEIDRQAAIIRKQRTEILQLKHLQK